MCLVQCMYVELVERGVYGDCPKWCMVALEKWIWPFTAFEAPYITQAMTLLICASHCVPFPFQTCPKLPKCLLLSLHIQIFVTRIQTACNDHTNGL